METKWNKTWSIKNMAMLKSENQINLIRCNIIDGQAVLVFCSGVMCCGTASVALLLAYSKIFRQNQGFCSYEKRVNLNFLNFATLTTIRTLHPFYSAFESILILDYRSKNLFLKISSLNK